MLHLAGLSRPRILQIVFTSKGTLFAHICYNAALTLNGRQKYQEVIFVCVDAISCDDSIPDTAPARAPDGKSTQIFRCTTPPHHENLNSLSLPYD